MEYYSAIKKNEVLPFETTWMDLEGIMLNEIRQRKTNTVLFYLYVESKKQNKWTNRQKQSHKYREQTGGYQRRGGGVNRSLLLSHKKVKR